MATGERTLLLRGLAILLVAGVVRVALDRTRATVDVLAGLPDAAAALDSAAERLAAETIERTRPLEAGEQIDAEADVLMSALEPLIIAGAGILVGAMVVSMYLPIFDLSATAP